MIKMGTALLISGLLGTVAGTIIERPGIERVTVREYQAEPLSLDNHKIDNTTGATIRRYYKSVSVCWHMKEEILIESQECKIRYISDPQFSKN